MPSKRMGYSCLRFLGLWALAACFQTAAAQEYHPGDVAVINRILTVNSAGETFDPSDFEGMDEDEIFAMSVDTGSVLAENGWEVGRPETWQPFEAEDSYRQHDAARSQSTSNRPVGETDTIANRIVWENSRIVEIILVNARLDGVLDLTGLSRLVRLNINDNSLTGIKGLDTLPRLHTLEAWRNSIAEPGDMSALKELRHLNLGNNSFKKAGGLEKLVNLTFLAISSRNDAFEIGDLGGLTKLKALNIGVNGPAYGMGDLSTLTELEFLEVHWQTRRSFRVDLGKLGKLRRVDFGGSNVSSLGTLSCGDTLVDLSVRDTGLSDVPSLAGMKMLRRLDIRGASASSADLLRTLPDGLLEEFRFKSGQFPTFRLRDAPLKNLKRLYVHVNQNIKTLDLSGARLDYLEIATPWVGVTEKITADQLGADGGSFAEVDIEGSGYSMTDLRALYDKLRPTIFRGKGNHSRLGDVAGEFVVGRPYALGQLSPRLAEEFKAAGEGATVCAFDTGSMFIDLNSIHPFKDGKLTFVEPGGKSVLIITDTKDGRGGRRFFSVIYTDRFPVAERVR